METGCDVMRPSYRRALSLALGSLTGITRSRDGRVLHPDKASPGVGEGWVMRITRPGGTARARGADTGRVWVTRPKKETALNSLRKRLNVRDESAFKLI
jgi:hypothetical protein